MSEEYFPMFRTQNCIVCGEPARLWTGFVRDPGTADYIAGFCQTHRENYNSMPHNDEIGIGDHHCYGKWLPSMGKREEVKSQ